MDEINNGSNLAGINLLLNAEKISHEINIADIEKKVKGMYNEVDIEADDAENNEEELDIVDQYDQAMEEITSVFGDAAGGNNYENEYEDNEVYEEDEVRSMVSNNQFIEDPKDEFYTQKTRDEYLQTSIVSAMRDVPKMDINLDQEMEDERKNFLLDQIDSLKEDLTELGINVDGQQYFVSYDMAIKRIDEVYRRLSFKHDKLKYNAIAEEALVAGASLLELVFNGKHEYFGVKPDITGYSDVVKSKLKRIRFETSTAVSRFVSKNKVGLMPRLMMELLPALITQSQKRKLQSSDTLNSTFNHGTSIRQSIGDLNNIMNS